MPQVNVAIGETVRVGVNGAYALPHGLTYCHVLRLLSASLVAIRHILRSSSPQAIAIPIRGRQRLARLGNAIAAYASRFSSLE